jgi:hypothetical protein
VAVILALLGVLRLITPDPRLSLIEQPIVLRRIVRGAAIAALLLSPLHHVLQSLETGGYFLTLGFDYAAGWELVSKASVGYVVPFVHSVVPWTFGCALLATWVAASFYLARLGERIPNMKLVKRTRSTARRFAISFVIYMVSCAVFEVAGYSTFLEIPLLVALFIGLFGILVFGFSLIFRWVDYGSAIKRCLLKTHENEEE